VDKPVVRVLLVEDNPGDVRLIQEALADARWSQFELERVDTLAAALSRAREGQVDVMLLDLTLPDSHGLETVRRAHAEVPEVPIVVLTGFDDQGVAFGAVNEGAQDFLVKGRVDGELLDRAIRYAVERHRMLEQVRQLAILDPLTGLANRRGFTMLCQHHLELANRRKKPLSLLFLDLDRMKAINDAFGHAEGDRALTDTAQLLRMTFRKSDIVARLGGDEFCVLLTESVEDGPDLAIARLEHNLAAFNAGAGRGYVLTLSTGLARYDPAAPCSLDALLEQADRAMYEQKKLRRQAA